MRKFKKNRIEKLIASGQIQDSKTLKKMNTLFNKCEQETKKK